jgi:hypothetical protein
VKSLRDEMEIVNAYELVGSYRGAAALCGTTAKTVKRVLERRAAGSSGISERVLYRRLTAAAHVLGPRQLSRLVAFRAEGTRTQGTGYARKTSSLVAGNGGTEHRTSARIATDVQPSAATDAFWT